MQGVAELEELVDKPGTTPGTWFYLLHFIRLPSLMRCGLATGPLVRKSMMLTVFRVRVRPAYLREALLSRINPILWHTVASFLVFTSPLAATTVGGLLETLTVSNSAEFRSFLLDVCMDAPESTTNSLSSGFILDGAGRHDSLVSEKKVALSVSLSFTIFLANLHASPRAQRIFPCDGALFSGMFA